jgi:hypothetical protein
MVVRKGFCFELIQDTIELAQYGKINASSRVLREACTLEITCSQHDAAPPTVPSAWAICCASVMRLVDTFHTSTGLNEKYVQ